MSFFRNKKERTIWQYWTQKESSMNSLLMLEFFPVWDFISSMEKYPFMNTFLSKKKDCTRLKNVVAFEFIMEIVWMNIFIVYKHFVVDHHQNTQWDICGREKANIRRNRWNCANQWKPHHTKLTLTHITSHVFAQTHSECLLKYYYRVNTSLFSIKILHVISGCACLGVHNHSHSSVLPYNNRLFTKQKTQKIICTLHVINIRGMCTQKKISIHRINLCQVNRVVDRKKNCIYCATEKKSEKKYEKKIRLIYVHISYFRPIK